MDNLLPPAIYFQTLPRKICSAAALFFNERGQLLIVKPTYRDHWLLPGGGVEADESPRLACIREIQEEIGLALSTVTLLCVDYLSKDGDRPELMAFIFHGKTLRADEIRGIVLPEDELSEFRFIDPIEAPAFLSVRMAGRLPHCLRAREEQRTVYLEDGQQMA